MRVIHALCILAASTAPAAAAIVVEVGSAGRDCYDATLQASTPDNDRSGLLVCQQAVESPNPQIRVAALVNRSDIRLRMQDFNGAVADAEQALALPSGLAVAHLNRGAGLVGLKRDADALPVFDRAIALGGDPAELIYYDRAMAKENLGDLKGAYADYRKALEINPKFQMAADELTRFKVTTR